MFRVYDYLMAYYTAKDEVGHFYGRLAVIERADNHIFPNGNISARWRCVCQCGKEVVVIGSALRSGNTTSCGCVHDEASSRNGKANVTHGMARFGTLTTEYKMWAGAKVRARENGLVFTIVPEDIVIPVRCPMLDVKLEVSTTGHPTYASPTLDRRVNALGYTKQNIWVICSRANRWKSNFTLTELKRMVTILEDQEHKDEIFDEVRIGITLESR